MSWGTFTHNIARLIPTECRPYACSSLNLLLNNLAGVYAYYPMGSNGQGVPTSVGSTLFTLPAAVGQDISVGTTEGFGVASPSVYGDNDCTSGNSLDISKDVSAPQSLGQAGTYSFTEDFGTALLGTGANISLVMKPDDRVGSGVVILQAPNLEVATENFTGSRTLPEWRFALGVSLRLDAGSAGNLRSVSMTNAMLSSPNSGGGTITLSDVIDSDDARAVMVSATWRMDQELFENASTNNEPAYSMYMKLRVDYDDGTSQETDTTVWETIGFSSAVDPEDVNNFTRALTPATTPAFAPSLFTFMSASDSHPLYNDFVLYENSAFEQVRVAFLRSFEGYVSPATCYSGQAECREYSCQAILESYASYASGGWSSLVTGESAWPWPFPLSNSFTNNAGSFGPSTGANTLDMPSGQAVPISSCDDQEDLFIQVSGNSATYKPYQLNDQRYFMVLGPYGLDLVSSDNASEMKWVSFFEHQYTNTNSNSPGTTFTSYEQTSLIFSSEDSGSDSVHDRLRVTAKIFGGSVVAVDLIDYADIFDGSGSLWVPVEVGISTTTPVEVSGRWESDVTFTVRIGEHSQTYIFSDQDITGGTIDIVDWATEDLSELDTGNRPLSNLNGSQVVALGGIGIAPDDMEYSEFKLAFERNRSTYTTPEYC